MWRRCQGASANEGPIREKGRRLARQVAAGDKEAGGILSEEWRLGVPELKAQDGLRYIQTISDSFTIIVL